MELIREGIMYGLGLTILLGPIFIALTQTAVEKGFRSGISVGVGIWTSDIAVIAFCIWMFQAIKSEIDSPSVKAYVGLTGGLILLMFGVGSIIKPMKPHFKGAAFKAKNFYKLWFKGFVVNTLNPFTFIFWIGLVSTYVIGRKLSQQDILLFFGSIMATIMITDTLKVYLAKKIRNHLNEKSFKIFSRVAGVALIVSGIVLIYRVL